MRVTENLGQISEIFPRDELVRTKSEKKTTEEKKKTDNDNNKTTTMVMILSDGRWLVCHYFSFDLMLLFIKVGILDQRLKYTNTTVCVSCVRITGETFDEIVEIG